MTKPKEYPLNRRGWAVFESRIQGGSWMKGLCAIKLERNDGSEYKYRYFLHHHDPMCFIGESVNPCTGKKISFGDISYTWIEHIISQYPRGELKNLQRSGYFKSVYFNTEGTKEKRKLIAPHVCDLFRELGRAPTKAELKVRLLQKEKNMQIQRELRGANSNSYMRRYMIQCMLNWLPTGTSGKRIIELPPPYGYKDLFLSFLYNGDHTGKEKAPGRCSLKLFFQLEKGEEWPPPKKKRGRPRKDTEKR